MEGRKNEYNAQKPTYHNKIIHWQQVCMETERKKMSKTGKEEMKSRGIGKEEEESGRQRAACG